MLGVKYIGAVFDTSGYAEAARNNIAAMVRAGLEVTVEAHSYERQRADYGNIGRLVASLVERNISYDFVILHSTPEQWSGFFESEKYHIGLTVWETSRIHRTWTKHCNTCVAEMWVPSSNNQQVFFDSGVVVPIHVVPHAIDTSEVFVPDGPSMKVAIADDMFVFGSVFQWIERKSPVELITAYLQEFSHGENVVLLLKTYAKNAVDDHEKQFIRDRIEDIKKSLSLDLNVLPKIIFVGDLVKKEQLASLYRRFDVLVQPSKGEGFGLPMAEAMACGTPVITTAWGGQIDFVNETNGWLVKYTPAAVYNMSWSLWYEDKDQQWAIPRVNDLRLAMRQAFEDRDLVVRKGKAARRDVKQRFSLDTIGQQIATRLVSIS